jgi:hypothetical protein
LSLLFRNRWFALLYLAMTIASAAFFVGEQGGAALVRDSANQIRTERERLQNPSPSTPHVFEAEVDEGAMPMLLPGDDPKADPQNPKPGDEFIDAMSGERVKIVSREEAAAD